MKQLTRLNGFLRTGVLQAKIRMFLLVLMLSGTANVNAAEAAGTVDKTEARVIAIKDRVTAIKAMDFSHMSKAQRGTLRHELKGMNKELKQSGPTYLYLGGGGLLLLIILLIIFL